MHGNEDDGYVVREHRKDDAVSASTLPIGGSDIWKRGYLSLFIRPGPYTRNYLFSPLIYSIILLSRMNAAHFKSF